ncbi:flagellar motor protein MotB [Sphingomonas ginkgonis]|uniref:Flagellar motor protein MotB n=1 Tax=Sphingomonas ginkgonis TaxID=2315330 RepID=A0A3R9Z787_9SPHN|nr:flagellar motor protein MotB [Sphingomonas ginkgonis]RST31539.1 flagellar motor protein MotB [Sphingomonas ginkgonis]
MSETLEPVTPIIVKKSIVHAHAGHHGGAWKVAYADFVTAMMAFFLLMWLLGATTEKQRKALADYFAPTIVEKKEQSAGADGLLGGDAIVAKENYPSRAGGIGERSIVIPTAKVGGQQKGKAADAQRFAALRQILRYKLARDPALKRIARSMRFTETEDGLRLDLVDDANFSMFLVGTSVLTPEAQRLLPVVAQSIADMPNDIRVRGHTDAAPFSAGGRNNWTLSTSRADATRQQLMLDGLPSARFLRIEGVADREPYNPADPYDPVNRRISITLGWTSADGAKTGAGEPRAGA